MPSAAFLREIVKKYLRPRFKFTYDAIDYSESVISISPIRRSDDLSAQYVTVTISDPSHVWDSVFRTDHTELTSKQAIISLCIGHIATITSSHIQFHECGASPDTITCHSGLSIFRSGTVIAISGSSEPANNTSVMITGVTDTTLTISTDDDLVANVEEVDTITLQTEAVPQFTGFVEGVVINHDQGTISLKLRERLSLLLENKVGDYSGGQITDISINYWGGIDPVTKQGINRTNANYASQSVWNLLTLYGKLDDTQSTANTDIDYTSYLAWKASVDNSSYILYDIGVCVGGGPSVANIVSAIAKLTVSQIWGGENGKIKFKGSMQSIPGVWHYTKANTLCAALEVSLDGRKNVYYTKYGYIPSADLWGSDQNGISAKQELYGPSGQPYTYQTEWEQDRQVYHNGIASADLYATESLTITAPPVRMWTLETALLGFLEDVGNEIIMEDFYATPPYDEMEVNLREVELDPMALKVTLKGYYIWGVGELA